MGEVGDCRKNGWGNICAVRRWIIEGAEVGRRYILDRGCFGMESRRCLAFWRCRRRIGKGLRDRIGFRWRSFDFRWRSFAHGIGRWSFFA